MRTLTIRTLTLLSLLAAAVALSGCWVIESESALQLDSIGDAEITVTACFNSGGPDCTSQPNVSGYQVFTNVLMAFRVPDGVAAPDSFSDTAGASGITFTRDDTYSKSLTDVTTARGEMPAGEKWVGYISGTSPNLPTGSTFTFKPHFKLLSGADGSAFRGPFTYRTVVGLFWKSSAAGPHPISCASDPRVYGGSPGSTTDDGTLCINSPYAADPPPLVYATDNQIPTRDLGITGGGSAHVRAGDSGKMAFAADYAGAADPAVTASISVNTTAPDVTLTPSIASITPESDSKTPIEVAVNVPPTTPLGSYDVTLVAKFANGQERRRTGTLNVDLGPPVSLGRPEMTGTFAVGQTVACLPGPWTGSPTGYAYQWMRDGTPIAGAAAQKYTLTPDDGAKVVACGVVASNAVGSGQATSGDVRSAQHGGVDVDLTGPSSATRDANGGYVLDPGITVSCPPRLPVSCGVGNQVVAAVEATLASARKAAAGPRLVDLKVAGGGFSVKSGQKLKIKLHLTHAGAKLLDRSKKLELTADVNTHSHGLERVSARKHFTIRRPR
jgi:hypothetical protein